MATTYIPKPVQPLVSGCESQRPSGVFNKDAGTSSIWIARAFIIGVAGALLWHTWGHWGDFQIDNGRELYVPAEILKGKLLFRDLWYMYGPLAAYVNAGLFWIFGVHLTVLYSFGFALTLGCALLTFEIARRFNLGILGSAVPALFFLVESFYPFIRNFIFPYSYAAALGSFLGLVCLYFVVHHASSQRESYLALATLAASLVLLTKQEIGFACLAMLGFEIVACYWIRRSTPVLLRNIAIFFAGLVPALAGYGWFVWKLSARTIFFENWISTPGTYFMRTFAKITMADQGFRFVPSELLEASEFTILGIALWALLAYVVVAAILKLRLNSRLSIGATILVCLSPLWISAIAFVRLFPWGYVLEPSRLASILVVPLTHAIFPEGIFFIVVVFTLYTVWTFVKTPSSGLLLQEAGLGIYASMDAVRQMMELRPSIYKTAVYFNVPAFLIFIILLNRIFRWACRSLDEKRGTFVAGSLLTAEICLIFLLFFPKPELLSTRLTTDYGSFYTRPDVATLFPQIVSFMKTHTRNGRDVLVLPEPPSLYVFAGMEAPSRMYSLIPGYVAPEHEQDYIDEISANRVRYVLIANRSVAEYQVRGFAQGGYNPSIYQWIMSNYVKVGQFGPLPNAPWPPYVMWIYEKRELVEGH